MKSPEILNRIGFVAALTAATLGSSACAGIEIEDRPSIESPAPLKGSKAEYLQSPERNKRIEDAVNDAAVKLIDAYEAGDLPDYQVYNFGGVMGSTKPDGKPDLTNVRGTFVSLSPSFANGKKDGVRVAAYVDENGLFDLSKGVEAAVEHEGRSDYFQAPTKVIPEGSNEVNVRAISPNAIPDNEWSIQVQYADQKKMAAYYQDVAYSADPSVIIADERAAVDRLQDITGRTVQK